LKIVFVVNDSLSDSSAHGFTRIKRKKDFKTIIKYFPNEFFLLFLFSFSLREGQQVFFGSCRIRPDKQDEFNTVL